MFKSPPLKNIAVTDGYMHDGRFATLEQVVDFYVRGVPLGPALDGKLRGTGPEPWRLPFSVADKAALVALLKTLTDNTLASDPKFADPFRR